jgi:single-stranded DNA-binding protein
MINEVKLSAGVTRIEQRTYGSDDKQGIVYSIGLAFQTDDYKSPTGYIDATVWNPDAEQQTALTGLTKGSKVEVEGTLGFDRWEQDGAKRSKVTLTVTKLDA